MVKYLSKISTVDKSYLDLTTLFKNNAGELYSFKVDSDEENGIVIRDTVGRSLPIDWYDVPEFAQAFNHFNELAIIINEKQS